MPDGKGRNQYQNGFPILQHINSRQRRNEQNVVKRLNIDDVLPADFKIEIKVAHR